MSAILQTPAVVLSTELLATLPPTISGGTAL